MFVGYKKRNVSFHFQPYKIHFYSEIKVVGLFVFRYLDKEKNSEQKWILQGAVHLSESAKDDWRDRQFLLLRLNLQGLSE